MWVAFVLSITIFVVICSVHGRAAFRGRDDDDFMPDACFKIGTKCTRKKRYEWLIDDIPHYWGNVNVNIGANNGRKPDQEPRDSVPANDTSVDRRPIIVSTPLPTASTSEWTDIYAKHPLRVMSHDIAHIVVANPVKQDLSFIATFILNTGSEMNVLDVSVARKLQLVAQEGGCSIFDVDNYADAIEGQIVALTLGNRDANGPSFPITQSFCAIPRKNRNMLSIALMQELNLAHFPTFGAFPYEDFAVHPKTHNLFASNTERA